MDKDLQRLKEIIEKIEKKLGKKFKSLNLKLILSDEGFHIDEFGEKEIKIKELDDLKGENPFDDTVYYDYEKEAIDVAIKVNIEYVKKEQVEAKKKLKSLSNSNSKKDKEEKVKLKEILGRSKDHYLEDSEEIRLHLDFDTITFGDVKYSFEDLEYGIDKQEQNKHLDQYLTDDEMGDFLTILEDKCSPLNISSSVIYTYEENQELEDEKKQKINKKSNISR